MSYRPPTLSIATLTLETRQASIKRDYTDTLRQYRSYQELIWESDAQGQPPREHWEEKLDHYHHRLRQLSYRHRAYTRAIALLIQEEAST